MLSMKIEMDSCSSTFSPTLRWTFVCRNRSGFFPLHGLKKLNDLSLKVFFKRDLLTGVQGKINIYDT